MQTRKAKRACGNKHGSFGGTTGLFCGNIGPFWQHHRAHFRHYKTLLRTKPNAKQHPTQTGAGAAGKKEMTRNS